MSDESQDKAQAVDHVTRLDHLKTGYCNAQDIIKFMDTKTGVVLGLCTVTMGLIAGLLPWFFEQDDTTRQFLLNIIKTPLGAFGVILALVSLISGVVSVFCCLQSLVGRPPLPTKTVYNILFPFFPASKIEHAKKAYIRKIAKLSVQQITSEFRHQIVSVGHILHKKMVWHWRSLKAFTLQFIMLVIAASVFALATFGYSERVELTKSETHASDHNTTESQPHHAANTPTPAASQ